MAAGDSAKADQIAFHVYTKLFHVLYTARASDQGAAQGKIDKWYRIQFNIETPTAAPGNTPTAELDAYRALSSLPPPAPLAVQVLLVVPPPGGGIALYGDNLRFERRANLGITQALRHYVSDLSLLFHTAMRARRPPQRLASASVRTAPAHEGADRSRHAETPPSYAVTRTLPLVNQFTLAPISRMDHPSMMDGLLDPVILDPVCDCVFDVPPPTRSTCGRSLLRAWVMVLTT
ncbi:hypothetical protein DFH06DRAFT_1372271 [Mycena polygramma]|nr:hypothetical protein DFH06DRAFT_1372271 [Mycena polygramma]